MTEIKFHNVPVSWTEDTREVFGSRDKHILVLLLTQTEVYVCVSANEHFGKNEPRKYTHGPYTKVLTPVWSETLCVSPHLSVQACHHPCYRTQSLTPCHSLPERHQWGLQLRGGWVCCSSAILHILPYCWAWTQAAASLLPLRFPEATAQRGKKKGSRTYW